MEGGLTAFDGLKVNISCLEVPGCWSPTTRNNAGCADADVELDGGFTLTNSVAGCIVAI